MKKKKISVLTGFIAALLFSAAAPLSKPLLDYLSDFQLAGLLYLGAALGVLPILFRKDAPAFFRSINIKDALRLSGAIIFGGILGPIFLLAGLRTASAGSVSLWLNLEMVATAVLGFFFFKDHLSWKGWIASIGALAAASLLAGQGGIAGIRAGGLVTLACICWGLDNHLTALIDGISPAQSTFWKGLIAGSFNLLLGVFFVKFTASPVQILGGLVIGAFSYGLSILLYIISAQQLGATRSQLIFSSAPFFGLLFSFILGESLTLHQILATGLFLGSIYLLFKETHSHFHYHPSWVHLHTHTHSDMHHDHEHLDGQSEPQWHTHEHTHHPEAHSHPHLPDIHHKHDHE